MRISAEDVSADTGIANSEALECDLAEDNVACHLCLEDGAGKRRYVYARVRFSSQEELALGERGKTL